MSVKIMTLVWEASGLTSTQKLVLLSLADHANDDGICYPSVGKLTRKTALSERSIQNCFKSLSDAGWIRIGFNEGPRGCNIFTISKPPQEMPPAGDAPPQEMREGVQDVRQTPAGDAPEPSKNHQEPSLLDDARETDAQLVRKHLRRYLSDEIADGFIAYRKKLRKPLTPLAARRQADQHEIILHAGCDPDDAVGMVQEQGWLAVKADWYLNRIGKQNGTTGKATGSDDPFLRAVARAAGSF